MADLIDRDAVIKQIAETQDKVSSGIEDVTFYRAIKIIRNAPAVNRWIPCSESLPEVWKEVLVVLNSNGYQSINIGEKQEEGSWMIGGEFWYEKDDPRITHWMPLPEPPESEVQNENL